MGTDSDKKLVEIGVVGRAHGLAGELHIFLHNPDSTAIDNSGRVFLKDHSGIRSVSIVRCRVAPKSRVVVFEGISSRTSAEQIKGAKVLVPREALPLLDDEEFYVADLIGIEAWDKDSLVGTITASRPQGDIEIITITGPTQSVEVPMVEDFILSIDFESGKIHLTDTDQLPTFASKKSTRKK